MKAPGTAYNNRQLGKDPQPAHMRNYVKIRDDNGGVHINSGIINHAFYLAATRHGGYAWETPGRTWFVEMTTCKSDETFEGFTRRTVIEALFGYQLDPTWVNIVIQARRDVGVLPASVPWYERLRECMGCGDGIAL